MRRFLLGQWNGFDEYSKISLPLGTLFGLVAVWYCMEKSFVKISLWKGQFISKRGRLTVIKNILLIFLIYCCLPYPKNSQIKAKDNS